MFVSNFSKLVGNRPSKRKQPSPDETESAVVKTQPKRQNKTKYNKNADQPLSKLPSLSQLDTKGKGEVEMKSKEEPRLPSRREILKIDRSAPVPSQDNAIVRKTELLKRQLEEKRLKDTKIDRRKQWYITPSGISVPPISDPLVLYVQSGVSKVSDSETFPVPIRATITTKDDDVVYDALIVPKERIHDYRTEITGIKSNHLRSENINTSYRHPLFPTAEIKAFKTVQDEVGGILNNRIIIGYNLFQHLNLLMYRHEKFLIRNIPAYSFFRDQAAKKAYSLEELSLKYTPDCYISNEHISDSVRICRVLGKLYLQARKPWEQHYMTKCKQQMLVYRKKITKLLVQKANEKYQASTQDTLRAQQREKKRAKDRRRQEKRWETVSSDDERDDDDDDDDDDSDSNDDSSD